MKKTPITCLLILLLSPFMSTAQSLSDDSQFDAVPILKFKFYGGLGASFYGGDVTGKKLSDYKGNGSAFRSTKLQPTYIIGAGYRINDRFVARFEIGSYGIKGKERPSQYITPKGGYEFKARNIDFTALCQFNILPYTYIPHTRFVPYAILGLGLSTSKAKGYVNGAWKEIRVLSNYQYKNKMFVSLPIGIGAMYRISDYIDLGLEGTLKYALGGSLDGTSKNGISSSKLNTTEQTNYFSQFYNMPNTSMLKTTGKINDMYATIQLRVQYTFIPNKVEHMFQIKEKQD